MSDVIRLGLLRLCDAAPVILADRQGVFSAHGVRVELCVEPSWANIADKLGYGLLEGAVMLPPLAMACAAGLRGRKTEMVVPMSLSTNGNAVTLASRLRERFAAAGIAGVAGGKKPRLAVVHGYSTQDLLLRYWLAANRVNPDRDVEITVLPPAEVVGSLAADAIDGFCAGAPWGQVAEHAGLGFVAVQSCEIWRDHPEKCLALRADFAARDPAGMMGLLRALIASGAACAAVAGRAALAELLAEPGYLDLPAPLIAGALDPDAGGPAFTAQYPLPAHGEWFAGQMLRWGKAPPRILDVAAALYRPDLFKAAGGAPAVARPEVFCDG